MADLEKMKIHVVVIVAQAIVGLAIVHLVAITVIAAIQEQAKAGTHHVIMETIEEAETEMTQIVAMAIMA